MAELACAIDADEISSEFTDDYSDDFDSDHSTEDNHSLEDNKRFLNSFDNELHDTYSKNIDCVLPFRQGGARNLKYWRLEEEKEFDEANSPLICIIQTVNNSLIRSDISCHLEDTTRLTSSLQLDEKLVSNFIYIKSHRNKRPKKPYPMFNWILIPVPVHAISESREIRMMEATEFDGRLKGVPVEHAMTIEGKQWNGFVLVEAGQILIQDIKLCLVSCPKKEHITFDMEGSDIVSSVCRGMELHIPKNACEGNVIFEAKEIENPNHEKEIVGASDMAVVSWDVKHVGGSKPKLTLDIRELPKEVDERPETELKEVHVLEKKDCGSWTVLTTNTCQPECSSQPVSYEVIPSGRNTYFAVKALANLAPGSVCRIAEETENTEHEYKVCAFAMQKDDDLYKIYAGVGQEHRVKGKIKEQENKGWSICCSISGEFNVQNNDNICFQMSESSKLLFGVKDDCLIKTFYTKLQPVIIQSILIPKENIEIKTDYLIGELNIQANGYTECIPIKVPRASSECSEDALSKRYAAQNNADLVCAFAAQKDTDQSMVIAGLGGVNDVQFHLSNLEKNGYKAFHEPSANFFLPKKKFVIVSVDGNLAFEPAKQYHIQYDPSCTPCPYIQARLVPCKQAEFPCNGLINFIIERTPHGESVPITLERGAMTKPRTTAHIPTSTCKPSILVSPDKWGRTYKIVTENKYCIRQWHLIGRTLCGVAAVNQITYRMSRNVKDITSIKCIKKMLRDFMDEWRWRRGHRAIRTMLAIHLRRVSLNTAAGEIADLDGCM